MNTVHKYGLTFVILLMGWYVTVKYIEYHTFIFYAGVFTVIIRDIVVGVLDNEQ